MVHRQVSSRGQPGGVRTISMLTGTQFCRRDVAFQFRSGEGVAYGGGQEHFSG